MIEILKADARRIKEASINNKLVVFVGAGVSMNSNLPSWLNLIDSFKEELPPNSVNQETDFLKVAQLYKNTRGTKEYIDKVRKELKFGNVSYNPINKILFDLNPVHIVTVNYDDLIEQASEVKNQQYFVIREDKDLPYASYSRFIIKMHGDLQIGNIVLTEDDYLNYESNFPLIETYIKSLFASKLVLFVGFSFSDYNLKIITNKVKGLLKDDFQPMYILHIGQTDAIMREYYKNRGLKIINYDSSIKTQIEPMLSKLEKGELEKISNDQGKKLYFFLKFVDKFQALENNYIGKHFIDVVYDKIKVPFSQLRVIGAKRFVRIFAEDMNNLYFNNFTLKTNNEDLWKLVHSLQNNIFNKRIFIKEYNYKYKFIKKVLNNNSIDYISDYKGSRTITIKNHKNLGSDRGLSMYYDGNFKALYEFIDFKKIETSESLTIADLEIPYLYYKIGNYYESYIRFKELAQKSWKQQKYVLYFICQVNRINLNKFILHESSEEEKNYPAEIIAKEVEEIKLQDFITNVSVESEIIRELFNEVYEYKHIYEIITQALPLYDKIQETSLITKKGGGASNSAVKDLSNKIYELWTFCNNNFIVSENFIEHIYIYKKAFEAFVVSNSIPESSDTIFKSSKLKTLQPFHLLIALFNCSSKDIIDIYNRHDIERLTFSLENTKFLNRIIDNTTVSISILSKDTHVTRVSVGLINNLLAILSKIEIDQSVLTPLLFKLSEAIETGNLKIYEIKESLIYFLKNKSKTIDDFKIYEQLLEKTVLTSTYFDFPFDLVTLLLDNLFYRNPKYKVRTPSITLTIINDVLLNSGGEFFLSKTYKLLLEKDKKVLKNLIEQKLKISFNERFFCIAYMNRVTEDNDLIHHFLNKLENYISSSTKRSDDLLLFYTLFKIYKRTGNTEIKERIAIIAESVPFLDFLLNPKSFENYSQINYKWINYLEEENLKNLLKNKSFKLRFKELILENPLKRNLIDKFIKYI